MTKTTATTTTTTTTTSYWDTKVEPRLSPADGEMEVTTLVSRKGWHNWYIWEESQWEAVSPTERELLIVPAPQGQTAFQAETVWTPLATVTYI
ncbi:hypothetical protein N658DRAFT_497662 [Parathielavia hyrcaniae]|uniref:Uncharacterized protein n=1 Tax=Parathielavia hyrcaniae TaxID=113614 RepID=A0AAN6PYJ7_9PEZI|nr:hypothetical protein N658DRAFT_497662 [Parathielavia hyrcaniae]